MPRRGGHWRFVEHTPDGARHGFEGRFREVTPPRRIVQTFEWDGMPGHVVINETELEDLGDGRTRLIIVSTRPIVSAAPPVDAAGPARRSFTTVSIWPSSS